MADMLVSKANASKRAGSSPASCTIINGWCFNFETMEATRHVDWVRKNFPKERWRHGLWHTRYLRFKCSNGAVEIYRSEGMLHHTWGPMFVAPESNCNEQVFDAYMTYVMEKKWLR